MRRSILMIFLYTLVCMLIPLSSFAENLTERYQVLKARHDSLVKENKTITVQIETEQKKLSALQRASKNTTNLPNQLDQCLIKTIKELQQQIKTGIPFDESIRLTRVEQLRLFIEQSASTTDKFRRVIEALVVEAQYGTSIETYSQRIGVDGQIVLANMVRIGKVGLFYTTIDRKSGGFYNKEMGYFQKLPSKYIKEIIAAGDMAQKRRPAELIRLPIGSVVMP